MADTVINDVLFHRITVNDQKVCQDCTDLESLPPMTINEWDASGQAPPEADTICYPHCRCLLAPSTEADIDFKKKGEELIEGLIDEVRGNIVTDITHGYSILLKDFEKVVGITTVPYVRLAKMESLISEWKTLNDFGPLPKEFFDLSHIENQIKWLNNHI